MKWSSAALWLQVLALGVLTSCSDDDPAPMAASVEPFGVATATALAGTLDARTALIIVVDGLTNNDIASGVSEQGASLPHIASLMASSLVYESAIAANTGGNAAMASLLTGLHSREHGVFSLRDLDRALLASDLTTLAETFTEQGWQSVASLSDERYARGVCGFEQGFAEYAAPRLGQGSLAADSVLLGLREALGSALDDPAKKVFALTCLSDVVARDAGLPSAERLAPLAAERLAPFRTANSDVEAALDLLSSDAEKALVDLEKLFSRGRGSGPARAWHSAIRSARLQEVDAAIGEMLGLLTSSGRAEDAVVVLTSLRGSAGAAGSQASGARFAPAIVRVPLVVHSVGGAGAGRGANVISMVDVAGIVQRSTGIAKEAAAPAGPATGGRAALVTDVRSSAHALLGETFQVERYVDGQVVWFQRGGVEQLGEDALAALPGRASALAALTQFAAPTAMSVSWGASAPALSFEWQLSSGSALLPGGPRRRPVRGSIKPGTSFELPLAERAASIRLGVRGPLTEMAPGTVTPSMLSFGAASLDQLPVLYVPFVDARPVEEADTPRLKVTRAAGLAWTLSAPESASGGPRVKTSLMGQVEVVLSVWPPRAPHDSIEVQATNARMAPVPGRADLVRFEGQLPLDVLLQKRSGEDFAIACRIEGRWLSPTEMAGDGSWFADQNAFDVIVPSSHPRVTAALYDTAGASSGSQPAASQVVIRRTGLGPAPPNSAAPGAPALDFRALEFIRFLPSGE